MPLDSVALREVRHLRELMEAWFTGRDEALRLQALEYERRLEELNHEAMRNAGVLAQSVTREVFDAYVATQRDQEAAREVRMAEKADAVKSAVEGRLSLLELAQRDASGFATGGQTVQQAAMVAQQARQRLWLALVGLSLTVAGLLLAIITR